MLQGTIVKIVREKGFGFILEDGKEPGRADLFFHRSVVPRELGGFDALTEGEAVRFERDDDSDRDKPRASHVEPVNG